MNRIVDEPRGEPNLSDWRQAIDFQRFEDESAIRIKFAAQRRRRRVSDALDPEYPELFVGPTGPSSWIPNGWTVRSAGLLETLTEYQRPAWHFSSSRGDVVADEHETGSEILVTIRTGVATSALVGLPKSLWKEWRRRRLASEPVRRGAGPTEEVLRVETTEELPDGTRRQHVLTAPAALITDKTFEDLVAGSSATPVSPAT